MDKTGIEWTDATWNPIRGCSKVSAGCKFCYAETMAARFAGEGLPYNGVIENGKWNGKITFHEDKLDQPLRWKKPRKIFVNSMSDLFHKNVSDEWLDKIFGTMFSAPHHTYQILTKRPERMKFYLDSRVSMLDKYRTMGEEVEARSNIWLGVSFENQKAIDERMPILIKTRAAVRWASIDPLLESIDFSVSIFLSDKLHWVVVGGESGPGSRPMDPDWARSLRDQCDFAEIPFLFKQWGDWFDGERVGKKLAGRHLDGKLHDGYPNED